VQPEADLCALVGPLEDPEPIGEHDRHRHALGDDLGGRVLAHHEREAVKQHRERDRRRPGDLPTIVIHPKGRCVIGGASGHCSRPLLEEVCDPAAERSAETSRRQRDVSMLRPACHPRCNELPRPTI